MSFDIYGNHLESGFCEVHPHVRQEYPCDICLRDARERKRKSIESRKVQQEYYKNLQEEQEKHEWEIKQTEQHARTHSPYPLGTQGDVDWKNGFERGVEWYKNQLKK